MAKKKETVTTKSKEKTESLAARQQGLDNLFEGLTKEFGIIGGRPTVVPEVMDRMTFKFLKTPVPDFNDATGGGIPIGHMTMIPGKPDSGKTGFALSTIGYQMQINPDFIALWIESEDSLDVQKAAKLHHIDLNRFYAITTTDPETKNQTFGAEAIGNAIIAALRERHIDMIVINSMKMLVPMAVSKKTMEQDTVGSSARFNSKFVQKVIPLIAQKNTALVVINQYTTNIGVMYGNPETPAGGLALKYNSMLIAEFGANKVQAGDPIDVGTGLKVHVRITKNHCIYTNPYVDLFYYVVYGEGIERYITTLGELIKKNIVTKSGSWLYYYPNGDGVKVPEFSWQGKNAFKADMIANPDKFAMLTALIDGGESTVRKLSSKEIAKIEAEEAKEKARAEKLGIEQVSSDAIESDAA